MNTASVIRSQVEADLQARVPAALTCKPRAETEVLPTGVAEVDRLIRGIPIGALTEIAGPNSSGRTSLLHSILAAAHENEECCALIDISNSFDPESANDAGVLLDRLLWIRCSAHAPLQRIEQALKSIDMILQGGGLGVVVFDLGDLPFSIVRRIPLTSWFRLRRTVENTRSALIVIEQEPSASTCASLVLKLQALAPVWKKTTNSAAEFNHGVVLGKLSLQVTADQDRFTRKPPQSATVLFESSDSILR
jgi:recombination protein RecA